MRNGAVLCALTAACAPFWAAAADGFLKVLSNNVAWADSAQWTNGAPASGDNAKATIFATNFAFTVNLGEGDSPWQLGKIDNKNLYNSFVTFKGGEFLLRGAPAELKSDSTTQFAIKSRLSVESNLLVSGMFFVQNTNRFDKPVNIRAPGGLYVDFPGGASTLPGLQGVGFAGFSSAAGGTLTVTNPASFAGGSWYIGSGALRTVKSLPAALTDPGVTPALVATPVLHLDASRLDAFTFTNVSQVLEWRDLSGSGYHARTVNTNSCPLRLGNDLGSMPAVDFGAFGSGQYMTWASSLTTARSIFWVVGSQGGGGFLLGGRSTAHFHRGANLGSFSDDPVWGYEAQVTATYLNGTAVDGRVASLSGGYDLLSVVQSSALTADGLAFDRAFGAGRSGGQRLAELVVYDRALADDERRQVEHYLYAKWLAKSTDLRHLQVVSDATLQTVSTDGETQVRRLQGRGTLTKTGAGTLRIEESQSYPGILRLAEGSIALTNPAAATSGALADSPIFRLDASAWATTMTLTNDRVYAWADADGRGISARLTNAAARPPVLIRNALNGRPVVDFGCLFSRQFLDWSQRLTTIQTVFWVVGSQNSGGFLLCEPDVAPSFHRGTSPFRAGDWLKLEAGIFSSGGKTTWVDGRLCDPMTTPLSGGYQILSTRCSSYQAASRIGADRAMYERSGGLRLAELVIYNRALTEQERLSTEAALRAKWMPSPAALATLDAAGSVGLRAENDLALDTLTGTGTVTKTGPGKVTLNGLASFTGALETDGGAFALASPGTAPAAPLAGYAAWFDASRTNTLTVDAATQRVTRWEDATSPSLAATNGLAKAPQLVPYALNGLSVLDFDVAGSGRYLVWTAPTGGVRTVFLVMGSQGGGGYLLGASHNTALFTRTYNNAAAPLFDAFTSQNNDSERERTWLSRSFAWIDGVPAFPNAQGLSGGYQLVSFLTGGDVKADGFAHNGAGGNTGGQRLAEVVVYDKPLSDADRKAVEAYLAAKWLRRALHGYVVPGVPTISGLAVAGASAIDLGAGQTNSVGWLAGSGSLVKSGTGTLEVAGSTVGFSGTLDVREGVLRLAAGVLGQTAFVTNQLLLNLDASLTNALTLDGEGKVAEWRDSLGGGRFATTPGKRPSHYADAALGGRPTVDFGAYGDSPYMMFDSPLTNAVSIFWVLGSQAGGGFLLGCYDTNNTSICDFHRGARVNNNLDPVTTENRLYGFNAPSKVVSGKTYVDGALIPSPAGTSATNILSGGYQMIETHCTSGARTDGLAMDRNFTGRRGGQRLAELLIYSRSVAEDERLMIEAYLKWKWFGVAATNLLYMPLDGASAGTVRVAAGATFELGGFTQNTGTLVGGGTISGGSLSVSGAVDLADPDAGTLTVNGDLALADGVTVRVSPGNTVDVNGTLTIGGAGLIVWPGQTPVVGRTAVFTYDALEGASNLSRWMSGEESYAGRFVMRAYAEGGTVYVLVRPKGTLFHVR